MKAEQRLCLKKLLLPNIWGTFTLPKWYSSISWVFLFVGWFGLVLLLLLRFVSAVVYSYVW